MGSGWLLWVSGSFICDLQILSPKKCTGTNPLFIVNKAGEQRIYS
jgi:hypothetical protein